MLRAMYKGLMNPVHPCRLMPTRHCPAVYEGECGERPCARYESGDESPWKEELPAVVCYLDGCPWPACGCVPSEEK